MISDRHVFLMDGVPLCLSLDIAVNLSKEKHKFIVVDKTGGKFENEFVKQLRKYNGDGIVATYPDKERQDIHGMLDHGLSRYGRVSRVVFFRQLTQKSDQEVDQDFQSKFLKSILNLKSIYESYLHKKEFTVPFSLVLSSKYFELEENFKKVHLSQLFSESGIKLEVIKKEFKTNPFTLSDNPAEMQTISTICGSLLKF